MKGHIERGDKIEDAKKIGASCPQVSPASLLSLGLSTALPLLLISFFPFCFDFVVAVVPQDALLSKIERLSEPFFWKDGQEDSHQQNQKKTESVGGTAPVISKRKSQIHSAYAVVPVCFKVFHRQLNQLQLRRANQLSQLQQLLLMRVVQTSAWLIRLMRAQGRKSLRKKRRRKILCLRSRSGTLIRMRA